MNTEVIKDKPIPYNCGACSKVVNFPSFKEALEHIEHHELEGYVPKKKKTI
jgi:hypothetical protein